MLNSEEKKTNDTIYTFTEDHTYKHPLSHLYTASIVTDRNHQRNEYNLYIKVCGYLDIASLCRISGCNKEFNYISSSESTWKPLCLSKWPELKMATSLEQDPFPAYKSCFKRKASQESTSLQDLMKIFGRCDWYSCPNGHLYAIGECRMAVMMSRCPECGESIGGRYHRHLDTNYRIGSVNASYNPLRYNLKTEDEVDFADVTDVIHTTRQTSFSHQKNNDLNTIDEEEIIERDNKYKDYYVETITETETVDFNALLKQFEDMEDAPEYLVCPLSLSVFVDPVVTPNGSIYERKFIVDWLENHDTDPMDANIKLNIGDLESEQDVKQAALLWEQSKDTNKVIGLKWANNNDGCKDHTSEEDEEWKSSDDNGDEGDINMNEFRDRLANIVSSPQTVNEHM